VSSIAEEGFNFQHLSLYLSDDCCMMFLSAIEAFFTVLWAALYCKEQISGERPWAEISTDDIH